MASNSSPSRSDPVLTSLCAICHIQPPKYRCPRCETRTCSLSCTRRHKSWSSCSGIRDATAYVPPSKLKTPAGIDHDFNFLAGIERAVRCSEREIVEERGLVTPNDLRPVEVTRVQWRTDRNGNKKKVYVKETPGNGTARRNWRGGGASRSSDGAAAGPAGRQEMPRQMNKRLAACGIHVRRVPAGMARQKDNGTNVAKASGRINWQIEWLVVNEPKDGVNRKSDPASGTDRGARERKRRDGENGSGRNASNDRRDQGFLRTTRIMGKALDHLPLYTAFANNEASHLASLQPKDEPGDQGRLGSQDPTSSQPAAPKKRSGPRPPVHGNQDWTTTTWPLSDYPFEFYPNPSWKPLAGTAPFTGTSSAELALREKHAFYISPDPHSKNPENKILVHGLDPAVPLSEALRDTSVLEFPTIYVFPASEPVPTDAFKVAPKPDPFQHSAKRKYRDAGGNDDHQGRDTIRQQHKRPRRDLEEGEVAGDDDDDDAIGDARGPSGGAGPSARGKGDDSDGEELGEDEVVEEESVRQDENNNEEEGGESLDDTTSSSGSDPDDDADDDEASTVEASLAEKLAMLGRKI